MGGVVSIFAANGDERSAGLDSIVAFRLGEDRKTIKTLGLTDAEIELVKSTPKPHGEGKFLTKMREAIVEMKSDSRQQAVADLLKTILDDSSKPAKVVIFATLPATADRLLTFLRRKFGPAVERHQPQFDTWMRFLNDPNCRVLVCDRQAEDGLNLQGARMILLHYDLPFARIGSNSAWEGSIAMALANRSVHFQSPIKTIEGSWPGPSVSTSGLAFSNNRSPACNISLTKK